MRPGKGENGSDRVEIIWNNFSITNEYLQVTVRGNDAIGEFDTSTGLAESDVFYFGNIVADAFIGAPAAAFSVNASDEIGARTSGGFLLPVTNVYDFNKDTLVNAADEVLARTHTAFLLRINIPAAGPLADPSATPAEVAGGGTQLEAARAVSASSEDKLAADQDGVESALAMRQPASDAASPLRGWLRTHLERTDISHGPKVESSLATASSDAKRSKIVQETADCMAEVLGLDDPLLDSLFDAACFE